ncbi:Na+/H+ antiporter [Variovorax sp. H27-G14]|uniref:Na+/H+ antiporter n=1 Tax=Variovorax sp. H27-G14 TaxID=3111914 RepID=UPI0038FCC38F
MQTVAVILFLLLAVVLSDFLARLLPFGVPRPVIQIALGSVMGLSSQLVVSLDPQVFFLLFLPPLLFLDGWRIPPEELFKDKGTVVQLALGLVVFTVLGMGVLIHALIPAMPLPVAFALAAVLSPTDPIAVSGVVQRVPMPRRMMHILEGESLLNDASGLVCFRFAVAAMVTGSFSLLAALLDFTWVATGGIAVGAGLTGVLTWLKNLVPRRLGEDSGLQILISLLIPFGCYLLAEELHCSGILAAVAAGLTMSFVESSGKALAVTRIRRNTFWDVIQFTASGIIFVLLGEQLHGIVAGASTTVRLTGHTQPAWLAVYVVAITLGLAALRFAWVMVSLRLRPLHARAAAGVPAGTAGTAGTAARPGWRIVAVMSLAGVRGAVTLAGVLSLPLTLPGGAPFPARDLAILLSMGVITLSLAAASIGMPLLLKGLLVPADPAREAEEAAARTGAAHAAIAEIERLERRRSASVPEVDIVMAAAARVMNIYRARIESRSGNQEAIALARRGEAIEREMRLAGLQAERAAIFRELRARRLGSETARKLIRELDLIEARYSS